MSTTLDVPCPHCSALNRVPSGRLAEQPVCGRCKQPLFDGKPATLTQANFDAVAGRGGLPVVIDFWAPWCGPCLNFAPVFAEATRALEPQLRLAKVDTEAEPALAQRFGIRSIPTLLVMRDGKEVARQAGALNGMQLRQFLGSVLG